MSYNKTTIAIGLIYVARLRREANERGAFNRRAKRGFRGRKIKTLRTLRRKYYRYSAGRNINTKRASGIGTGINVSDILDLFGL